MLQRDSRKAPTDELGPFDLIKESDRVIFYGNGALALVVAQQLISPKTIHPCSSPCSNERGRTEKRPIYCRSAVHVQRFTLCPGNRAPLLRKFGSVRVLEARSNFQAPKKQREGNRNTEQKQRAVRAQ